MPATLRRGRVTDVLERRTGLVRLEVDGKPCIAYPRLTGPVAIGDDVVVNTQARLLGLGSGGFDVLYVNLERGLGLLPEPEAHVMKLPYTPLQTAARHAEEDEEWESPPPRLSGLPVVCCTLHSQLAPACAGIGPGSRTAYVQLAGGALPVSLSDAVRTLKATGLLETSIAVGPCLDGDVSCITLASALGWASAQGFDAVVCSIGPGIAGTGSHFGHGAMAASEAANVAHALGGRAILAPRVSEVDDRERHRGLSHHTRAVLELVLGRVTVAWPAGLEPPASLEVELVDISGWRDACAPLPLESMGRGPDDDPWFFAAAYAAGKLARGAPH